MDNNEYCPYCTGLLDLDDRIMDLPCFHRVHTTCFLGLMNTAVKILPAAYHLCEFCQVPLFQDIAYPDQQVQEEEIQEEVEEEQEEEGEDGEEGETQPIQEAIAALPATPTYYERIRIRVQGDANIKKDIKLYFKAKYNENRKRTALLKYAKEKKNEIKNSVDNLREQLRTLIRAQKRVIMESQAYKEYKGAHFRKNIAASKFYKKYNLDFKDLRKAMTGQPGYKRWCRESSWRLSPSYILRKGFYRSYIHI